MTLNIPAELEEALQLRAKERQMSVDELVREALAWYMEFDPATLDELAAWQEMRDEALQMTKEPPA